MGITVSITIVGVLLFLTIFFGIWLSNLGRPLNTALFSIHKLVAVGFVVFGFFAIRALTKEIDNIDSILKLFIILAVISTITLFVTGGLLSFDRFANKFTIMVHALSPILTALSVTLVIYILFKQR
ncbi:MAG: hypothetical protein FXF54_05500 [Kosmotoga sp.]|nr:MAG: hypothetical protein FXF54_05500 [Kosmotoga sp.]